MSTPPHHPSPDPQQPTEPHSPAEPPVGGGFDDVQGQPRYGVRLPLTPDAAAQPLGDAPHSGAAQPDWGAAASAPVEAGSSAGASASAVGQPQADERPGWDQARPGSRRAAREAAERAATGQPGAEQQVAGPATVGQSSPGDPQAGGPAPAHPAPTQPAPTQWGQATQGHSGQPAPGHYGQPAFDQYGQPMPGQFGQQLYPGAFVPGGPYDHTGQVPQGSFGAGQAALTGQQGIPGQPTYPVQQGYPLHQGYPVQQGYTGLPGHNKGPAAPAGPRPVTVTVASILLWVGAALSVISAVVGLLLIPVAEFRAEMIAQADPSERADLEQFATEGFVAGMLWALVISTLIAALFAAFVGFLTWKGSNAWRIVGTVCGGIAALMNLLASLGEPLNLLQFLLAAAILVLWWLPASNRWFAAKQADKARAFQQPMRY